MFSIVIVFKDKIELLKNCVESIVQHTKEPYEIVLVSSCSSEDTNIEITRFKAKVVINNKERGFAYSNNLGVAASSGEYVVLLNNDTIVKSDNWLSERLEKLKTDNAELIGPNYLWGLVSFNRNEIPQNMKKYICEAADGNQICYFTGFWFVMAKRSLFEKMPLNEKITNYFYEDMDYCMRMAEKGIKWTFLHNESVEHLSNASIKELAGEHIDRARVQFLDSWR